MYAILKHGGHQYRVTTGDRLLVDRLPAEVGASVTLEPVLFIADGESTTSESEALEGASVTAVVVAHRRGHKIRVFSYKAKKRHRRTLGYRSQLTELRVDAVNAAGGRSSGDGAGSRPAKKTAARRKPADGA